MSGPRAGSGGPRAAPQRRADAGRRGPGSARTPAPATPAGRRAAHETREPAVDTFDEEQKSARALVAECEPPRQLSGLALLLDQLDALLRDPTLARALSRFASKLTASVRFLAAAIADAVRRLPAIRLPRRLLLGLLALALPLAVLALLTSGDNERSGGGASEQSARAPGREADGSSGAGVGVEMPRLSDAPEKVRPVSVALVLDGSYVGARRMRELRTLGAWLAENHAAGTRVSVIDADTGRASAALGPEELERARLTRVRASTPAAIRSTLTGRSDRQLLVTLGVTAPASGARTLSIATRRGVGSGGTFTTRGTQSETTIDARRPDALAASVARGIMTISGQTETP